VDFLVLSRASSAGEPDDELNERHWAYMDRFADGMTARGPTLATDRDTWTGSMHVVALPSVSAAHAFVADEPYERAGLFERRGIWRFTDLLGRTMWEHVGLGEEPTFLVITPEIPDLPTDRFLMSGALHTLDDAPAGFVVAVQVPDRSALHGLVGAEVHDWEPGGRR